MRKSDFYRILVLRDTTIFADNKPHKIKAGSVFIGQFELPYPDSLCFFIYQGRYNRGGEINNYAYFFTQDVVVVKIDYHKLLPKIQLWISCPKCGESVSNLDNTCFQCHTKLKWIDCEIPVIKGTKSILIKQVRNNLSKI